MLGWQRCFRTTTSRAGSRPWPAGPRRQDHQKKFRFADFREAMRFVNRVADLAELEDHHRDIFIHYREVTLTLWTHAAGGLTERDFKLAADIDRVD